MTPMKPIDAYFAQGLRGNHVWWTWLAGFWFAIIFWVIIQTLIGIPMFGAMAIADPDAFSEMFSEMMSSQETPTALSKLSTLCLLALTPLAVLLFALRKQFSDIGSERKIVMWIAGLCALASGLSLIYTLVNQPSGANEMMGEFIPKSSIVYACLLLTFPPLIGGLWIVQKFVHERGLKPLMTAAKKFRWKRVFVSMLVFWAIAAMFTFIGHSTGLNKVTFVFNPERFFIYAAISLCLIPLQSATEEIILRGYLNQGLGKYIKNPWIVFVITSAMFAALHLGNPEAAKGAADGQLLLTMSAYFFFGFFACVLTYIDGGLESAIGVHAANNLYASILLGYDNSALPTPTVLNTTLNPSTDSIFTILTLALVCFIMWKMRKPLDADLPSQLQ